MSTAVITRFFWPTEAPSTTAPERKPTRAPVFIGDAVIPCQGETLLLKLLRDQAMRELESDPPKK